MARHDVERLAAFHIGALHYCDRRTTYLQPDACRVYLITTFPGGQPSRIPTCHAVELVGYEALAWQRGYRDGTRL